MVVATCQFYQQERDTVIVEADGLPGGLYLYRLETRTHTETKRMLLSR